MVRDVLPELFTLGDYDPAKRTGPAIWLRCVVDETVSLSGLPADRTPILYLPRVARDQLRAGRSCRDALKPLVELMFRGVVWHHPNGRDWSVRAFLTSDKVGPGLDIAADNATLAALQESLDQLATTPTTQLRGRRLDFADFHRISGIDTTRDILRWMGDPERLRKQLGGRWPAFCRESQKELAFDPEVEEDVTAGARLGRGEGRWAEVWGRFTEVPANYPGVPKLLRRSRPTDKLALFSRERWPDLNDEEEAVVRKKLVGLPELPVDQASAMLRELDREHAPRREWVWTTLGHSPMAQILEPLAKLASSSASAIGGTTPDDIANTYAEKGWRADAAAREALAMARSEDEETIAEVVRHLLEPWLEDSARAFQAATKREALPTAGDQPSVAAREDECIMFVDGLRYDLGRQLASMLEEKNCETTVEHRWAALPTVTATGKPAVSPVAAQIVGEVLSPDFRPCIQAFRRPVLAADLRLAMEERGYQIVGRGNLEMPLAAGARGWLECGKIDKLGHEGHGPRRLARLWADELEDVARRIADLLDLGWRAVRVVTDHGWIFLPGGLPMVTLPKHLTESQWARAAVVAGASTPDMPRRPWYWNPNQEFATPPGIACFSKRDAYAHGGVSVQECLIPDLRVSRSDDVSTTASIQSVNWVRLRCHAVIGAEGSQVTADLRLNDVSGESVAAKPKTVDEDGSVSLVLADDEHENAKLVLVVTDGHGSVLAWKPTRKGANS